ncbi:MAG: hypothetical protein CBB71_11600, partial [Rhodopirellula sp. TMED11]
IGAERDSRERQQELLDDQRVQQRELQEVRERHLRAEAASERHRLEVGVRLPTRRPRNFAACERRHEWRLLPLWLHVAVALGPWIMAAAVTAHRSSLAGFWKDRFMVFSSTGLDARLTEKRESCPLPV